MVCYLNHHDPADNRLVSVNMYSFMQRSITLKLIMHVLDVKKSESTKDKERETTRAYERQSLLSIVRPKSVELSDHVLPSSLG